MSLIRSDRVASPEESSIAPLLEFAPRSTARTDAKQVPVRVETVVQLELACSQPSLDLEVAAQIILGDMGATVQILRAAAKECGDETSAPTRVRDCIVILGKSGVVAALNGVPTRLTALQSSFLDHCLEVAHAAKTVAHAFPVGDLEDAYLAGMFHDVATMPEIFPEWRFAEGRGVRELMAGTLCQEWSLPAFVTASLNPSEKFDAYSNQMATIVAVAHEVVILEASKR